MKHANKNGKTVNYKDVYLVRIFDIIEYVVSIVNKTK